MSMIRRLLGFTAPLQEEPMPQPEQPQPVWKMTDPDAPTRKHDGPWQDRPAEKTPAVETQPGPAPQPAAQVPGPTDPAPARPETMQRIPMPVPPRDAELPADLPRDPVSDSGVHYMGVPGLTAAKPAAHPTPSGVHGAGVGGADDEGERCSHCGGKIPGDHDLLVEILGWLSPVGEQFVREFYVDLFAAAPDLRPLFPDDIKIQEERLLTAVFALLQLFQAGDKQMEQLDSALARFGRSHTRFDPAASIEEYAAVWTVLAGVAVRMLGGKLTGRHAAAFRRAYEYAAGMMLAAQATAKLSGTGRRRRTV